MDAPVLDGRAVGVLFALMAVEAAGLIVWRALTGSGPAAGPLIANLLSGALLLSAAALSAAGRPSIAALAAALALAAHLVDLADRWSRAPGRRRDVDARPQMRATIVLRAPARDRDKSFRGKGHG